METQREDDPGAAGVETAASESVASGRRFAP